MTGFKSLVGDAAGLLDLLLPECCPICDHPAVLQPEGLCCSCLKQIVPLPSGRCPRCSLPYPAPRSSGHLCGRCITRPPTFAEVVAVGRYQDALQTAIRRFKSTPRPTLDKALGRQLAAAVTAHRLERRIDLVVPVPLHARRLRQRGFNQSALLAAELSRGCQLPLAGNLLLRIRATPPQQNLNADRRQNNLRGAVTANRQLDREHVLLVDDVMTTGATADACARALLKAGAGLVSVAVLARADRHLHPTP